jgi:hypothetical protein
MRVDEQAEQEVDVAVDECVLGARPRLTHQTTARQLVPPHVVVRQASIVFNRETVRLP